MNITLDKNNKNNALINIGDASFYVYGNSTSDGIGETNPFCDLHIHAGFEIQYVGSGSLLLHTEYGEFEAPQESVIIIPPNNYHQLSSKAQVFSRHCFSFSVFPNSEAKMGNEYITYNRILSKLTRITVLQNKFLSDTMQRIMEIQQSSKSMDYRGYSLLTVFLTDMFSELENCFNKDKEADNSAAGSRKFNYFSERQQYIIENCLADHFAAENPIKIIEDTLNTSKRNAARIVYNLFGENTSDLVLKYRMKIAKMYIENSDFQLNEISEKVGYKTYVTFFTAFKKYYGISPTEYRENKKAE